MLQVWPVTRLPRAPGAYMRGSACSGPGFAAYVSSPEPVVSLGCASCSDVAHCPGWSGLCMIVVLVPPAGSSQGPIGGSSGFG